jgi:hypothetical protein
MWACSSANGRAFRGRPQQRRTPHSLARFSLGDTIADGWRVLSADDRLSRYPPAGRRAVRGVLYGTQPRCA